MLAKFFLQLSLHSQEQSLLILKRRGMHLDRLGQHLKRTLFQHLKNQTSPRQASYKTFLNMFFLIFIYITKNV